MKRAITRASTIHEYTLENCWRDEFGLFWNLYQCPACGKRVQVGPRIIVLDRGSAAMTEQDSRRIIALRKAGQHQEANKLAASFPAHRYGGMLGVSGIEYGAPDDRM
jgi:hypothetical protein